MTRFSASIGSSSIDLVSRRGFIRAGSLAFGGLGADELLRMQAAASPRVPSSRVTSNKAAIMIFLSGGPSHLDMYDMKPGAPSEYRGEFHPIRTNVPGIEICELMPMQAKIADKFTILRGFQGAPLHTGNEFFCGYAWQNSPRVSIPGEAQRPALGSVMSRLGSPDSLMPPYVSFRGQHQWERAYYLGNEHEPLRIAENSGTDRGEMLADMAPPKDLNTQRLRTRSDLLNALDRFRRERDARGDALAMDSFQRRALGMISSSKVSDAFDVTKEPEATRIRYGEGLDSMGQDPWKWLLQARRLVESGVSVVTVCIYGWDTHRTNFKTLRRLIPPLDRALHALITDLEDRGMSEDVVVLLGGEFGRTPRIGDQTPDGRGHWLDAGFLWIAGGGLRTGQVLGQTDARGEQVIGNPIRMQSVLNTVYGVLGVDPATTFEDFSGRPQYLLDDREPLPGLV